MKIYKECSLTDFEPWSGGADRFRVFTCEQLETIEQELEVLCPDGMSKKELFWGVLSCIVRALIGALCVL